MRRTICGMVEDSSETVALFVPDEQATGRIFAAADYYADEKDRRRIMRNALLRLKRNDRNFARAVLGGATHRELGISRQAFARRMKKILEAISTKTKKIKKLSRPHKHWVKTMFEGMKIGKFWLTHPPFCTLIVRGHVISRCESGAEIRPKPERVLIFEM